MVFNVKEFALGCVRQGIDTYVPTQQIPGELSRMIEQNLAVGVSSLVIRHETAGLCLISFRQDTPCLDWVERLEGVYATIIF